MRKIYLIILMGFYAAHGKTQSTGETISHESYLKYIDIVQSGDTNQLNKLSYNINEITPLPKYEVPLLFHACSYGQIDMVNYLLKHGSDPNFISAYGTAANWAAERGHLNIINVLLDHGFNPKIEEMDYWVERYKNGESEIPKWLSDVIKDVLDKNTDYHNYPVFEYTDPADALLLSASIVYDTTPKLKLTKKLLKYGVNVNLIDKKGLSPIHISIVNINVPALSLLIKNGANIEMPIYSKLFSAPVFNNNLTPLHLIMYQIKENPESFTNNEDVILEMIKVLVKAGANVNAKTKNEQQTVIEVAKEINNPKIIKILKKGKTIT